MLQTTSKNSSGRVRECHHEEQREIFCEQIREFISDSRRCQTLYANFEGYHERTVEWSDITKLDDLVFLTLSDGKDRASLTPDEFAETEKLAKLMAKKIYNSCKNFKCNNIRFQVVWVYYFDYSEKEMKAMPVYKVYKRNWGPEALYIDVTLVDFDCWDHFTMHSQFPVSFICIPRRGEYTFRTIDGGDMLDLEYVCKNEQLRNEFTRSFRPFSQTLIQRMLHKTMPFVKIASRFLPEAIKILEISGFNADPKVQLFIGILGVVVIVLRGMELKWEGNGSEKALESTAADYSLMLLNDSGQKPSRWKNCLNLMYDLVERSLTYKSFIAVQNFLENPRENWMEILKCVPVVIEVCKPYISEVSGGEGVVLRLFLEFISTLSSEQTEKKKIKGKGSEESENWLCNLEKYSSGKVFSDLEASPWQSTRREVSKPPLDLVGREEYGLDLFGFRVYLLLKHTRPDCKRFLQRLLKSNYTLEEGIAFQNVVLDGDVIGIVIPFSFQSQNHAIVVLNLDKFPGGMKKEIGGSQKKELVFH